MMREGIEIDLHIFHKNKNPFAIKL